MQRAFAKIEGPEQLVVMPDVRKAVNYVLGREEYANRNAHPAPIFIILDLKMPNLTGMEALREIRSARTSDDIPEVLLTSSTHETDIAAARDLKANDYFVKPSNATELIALLKKFSASIAPTSKTPITRLEITGNRLPA